MSSLKPGDLLASKYRLHEVIGRGGFATVYRAVDETLGRNVAVKLLDYGRDHGAARFVREAKILGELQDGHTMRLFDFGRSDDGTLFMVCELLGGQDLSDLLEQRGTLTPNEAEHIMRQILSSLREAHAAGLLHRDVKPDNIRVQPHNDDPLHATLMDFGVARQEVPGAAKLTATGVRIGTAAYMAPEQAIGAGVGKGTDLFSLGLVIAQCITGDLRMVRSEMMRKGGPNFGEAREPLVRALTTMLELDIADRPPSAEAVLAILDSPPRIAPPQRPPSGSMRPPSRPAAAVESRPSRPWLGIAGVVLSIMIIGAVFAYGSSDLVDDDVGPSRPIAKENAKKRAPLSIVQAPKPPDEPPDLGRLDAGDGLKVVINSEGCGQMPEVKSFDKRTTNSGLDTYQWRRHLPAGYDPAKPHPVLLAFHTDDGRAQKLVKHAKLDDLADKHGMVLIAFNGARPIAWSKMYPDSALDVLKHNQREVCVDPTRVVVLGYGAGGLPAEELSCEKWVHAAIFVSHRTMNVRLPCPRTSKPMISFQPLKSKHLPVEGGWNCSRMREHVSLAKQEAYLRQRNGCGSERKEVVNEGPDRCYSWDCKTPLTICHIDGGHQFPGMPPRKIDVFRCDGPETNFAYPKHISKFLESVL